MAQDQAASQWRTLIKACFLRRVPSDQFADLVQALKADHPTLSSEISTQALFDAGHQNGLADPRLAGYLEVLLDSNIIEIDSPLAILQPSIQQHGVTLDEVEGAARPHVQTVMVQSLAKKIAAGIIEENRELFIILHRLVPWINYYPSSMTLGFLVSATLGCFVAQRALLSAKAKKIKASFGQSLTLLINNLSQVNIQLANTLAYWQKHYQLHDELSAESMDLLNNVELEALSFQEGIIDNMPVNSRSGLYIYLNAALSERPLFDDMTVMSYLNMRYKGEIASLTTELILASFDILANAMYRNEPSHTITRLRSFLVNKLPNFLSNYAVMMFPPLSIETCISQALLRIDPAAFPSFSQMFDPLGKGGVLSEARQEFLFACALHQLIPEGSIEGLLGDVPMQSLPAGGRYARNELVAQCTSNPARIEELIGELENMEGNAGEIAGAMIEALLQPLCGILDNWQEQEDQGESQPVYDEFGSILLLVLMIWHRFDLDEVAHGILDPNSFTAQYFRSASRSRHIQELTERESELLGGWVRGLFETEGINDELMSACKPAEFNLLVTTLFDQSIRACQAGVLAVETLKGGFEYFLASFLLPSLAAGLVWFANRIWETKDSSDLIDSLMPALHTLLLRPSSMSPDPSAMHSAVLAIVAEPLDAALTHAQRVHSLRVDISPMLDVVKPHMQKHRHRAAALQELETWASTPKRGLETALKSMIHALMRWNIASANSTDMSPPSYTHRLLLRTLQILGANATLNILTDEIMAQMESGDYVDMTFDIVVTMILAPPQQQQPVIPPPAFAQHSSSPYPHQHNRLTLREALHTQFAEANELSKTDTARASVVVRLYRRVEAFCTAAATMNADAGDVLGMGDPTAGGDAAADIDDVIKQTEDFLGSGAGKGMMLMG
ncbi:MAG: hypothetical protein L6R37_006254 [Teloschistes peruensis]|nr:MAG: hypothetical protein L6R37_006254 [Teloschistes peruensis]